MDRAAAELAAAERAVSLLPSSGQTAPADASWAKSAGELPSPGCVDRGQRSTACSVCSAPSRKRMSKRYMPRRPPRTPLLLWKSTRVSFRMLCPAVGQRHSKVHRTAIGEQVPGNMILMVKSTKKAGITMHNHCPLPRLQVHLLMLTCQANQACKNARLCGRLAMLDMLWRMSTEGCHKRMPAGDMRGTTSCFASRFASSMLCNKGDEAVSSMCSA